MIVVYIGLLQWFCIFVRLDFACLWLVRLLVGFVFLVVGGLDVWVFLVCVGIVCVCGGLFVFWWFCLSFSGVCVALRVLYGCD